MEFQSTLPVWGATSRRWSGGAQGEHFNPRSPCGERRQLGQRPAHSQPEFQSTLPVWGATGHPDQPAGNGHISIHAPRVGSDNLQVILDDNVATFQSTLPVWGATKDKDNLVGAINISIHAPRVGSDLHRITAGLVDLAISIHAPRVGSDEIVLASSTSGSTFQSTLPVWGATNLPEDYWAAAFEISIHAPRVGSDQRARRAKHDPDISIHAPRVGSDV